MLVAVSSSNEPGGTSVLLPESTGCVWVAAWVWLACACTSWVCASGNTDDSSCAPPPGDPPEPPLTTRSALSCCVNSLVQPTGGVAMKKYAFVPDGVVWYWI